MRGFLALMGGAFAAYAVFSGCSSSGATGARGSRRRAASSRPAYTRGLGTSAPLHPIDEAAGCVAADVTLTNLCVSSVSCSHAALLASVCLVSPDGKLYYATVTNDEDITGPGWHEVHDSEATARRCPPTTNPPRKTARAAPRRSSIRAAPVSRPRLCCAWCTTPACEMRWPTAGEPVLHARRSHRELAARA